MKNITKFYPHLLGILGFIVVALIYFYPVLQGKEISQSDIAQYIGMAKERDDFRAQTGEESYWTNSAFGGMPTYQLGAHYPHDYIKKIDSVLRFLPRPADYLFLYFIGFYVLMLVLKADPLKAFFGALAFGFSTYMIILLGVGHNAKAHAIAYMPMVVAGVILVFRRRYIAGGLLTLFAAALEINANHVQMTYYLFLFLLIIGIYFIIQIVKSKDFKHLGVSIGVFAVAGLLAIGANATNLMATAEYAKTSIRSNSELTFNPDGSPKENSNAMSYDYITEYSYGLLESFNILAPRLVGGASGRESLGADSEVVEYLQSVQVGPGQYLSKQQAEEIASQGLPTYWGDQPIVAAPAYIGAIVFFLFILALFADKRKIKYAFLAGAIVSLLLSWGKNFPLLTDFFINYVPMYNKFRAVASIQVILELCLPVMAIMGLYAFLKLDNKEEQWKALWKSAAVALGIILILLLFRGTFDFSAPSDIMYIQNGQADFISALKKDRMSMYTSDLMRAAVLIIFAALMLWLNYKDKLSKNTAVITVGLLMVLDLVIIDWHYVSEKANPNQYVSAREARMPFPESTADQQIARDTSNYRVFDTRYGLNGAQASYYHKSIGGYHAAKPRKIQQLFDYQISEGNLGVLNMLNVKYVIQDTEQGENIPTYNPEANGNAWFVSHVVTVTTPDEAMKALYKLDFKKEAVINKNRFAAAAQKSHFTVDSTATISLKAYEPNYLKYVSENKNDGMALFSEAYYANGWKAFIDEKPVDHFEANYMLRGLLIPAGKHTVEFKFEPQVVKTGSTIALISSILIFILLALGIYMLYRKKKADEPQQ